RSDESEERPETTKGRLVFPGGPFGSRRGCYVRRLWVLQRGAHRSPGSPRNLDGSSPSIPSRLDSATSATRGSRRLRACWAGGYVGRVSRHLLTFDPFDLEWPMVDTNNSAESICQRFLVENLQKALIGHKRSGSTIADLAQARRTSRAHRARARSCDDA